MATYSVPGQSLTYQIPDAGQVYLDTSNRDNPAVVTVKGQQMYWMPATSYTGDTSKLLQLSPEQGQNFVRLFGQSQQTSDLSLFSGASVQPISYTQGVNPTNPNAMTLMTSTGQDITAPSDKLAPQAGAMTPPADYATFKNPNASFQATGVGAQPLPPINSTYFLQPGETIDQYNTRISSSNPNLPAPGKTSSSGVFNSSTPFTSADLAKGSSYDFKTPPQTSPYDVSKLYTTPPLTETPQQQKESSLTQSLMDLINKDAGRSAYQAQQDAAAGVDVATSTVNDLSAKLQTLTNEAAAIKLAPQTGEGVTTAIDIRQRDGALRENAITSLAVSSLLDAAQANLATAQAKANKAVALIFDPIEAQIKADKENLLLIKNDPETAIEERNQAQAQLDVKNAQAQAIQDQKDNLKEIFTIAMNAAANVQNFTATAQYKTASQALTAIQQAHTKEDALQIAVSVGFTTSPTAPKVIGSASSGYYTVNPDGSTSPLHTGSGGTGTVGTGTGGTTSLGGGVPTSFTTSDIKEGDQVLRTGTLNGTQLGNPMGSDGYIDPAIYVKLLDYWIQQGGTKSAFFSKYPVKTYINPANTWVWGQLGIPNPFVKSSTSGGSTSDLYNSI